MATGETLMVMGAMVLLSALILSINGALLSNFQAILEGKMATMAISLGQQIIEEAIPRSYTDFEAIYPDYNGRVDYYRYTLPEGGTGTDFTIESLAAGDSSQADYRVSVTMDTTVGVGLAEMIVTVSSPYLDHDIDLNYVFSRQY